MSGYAILGETSAQEAETKIIAAAKKGTDGKIVVLFICLTIVAGIVAVMGPVYEAMSVVRAIRRGQWWDD